MPIYTDGVLIQECGGVQADAVNMELVQADATIVYDESCFSGIWTGSTEALGMSCVTCTVTTVTLGGPGINTSATQYRLASTYGTGDCTIGGPIYSTWLASDENGLDNGTVSVTIPTSGGVEYLRSTISSLAIYWSDYIYMEDQLYFDIADKFSGHFMSRWEIGYGFYGETLLNTSGGNVRIEELYTCGGGELDHKYGNWVTLN